ncbi:MAG: cobalt transport protein [Bacilli bacterium]|nr:cobalt transport protein [Bacilli bacterium]
MRESAENLVVLYTARNSWIETVSPFAKLVFTLFMTLNLIMIHQPIWMLGMLTGIVVLWRTAKQTWRHLLLSIVPVAFLFASTMVYNLLLTENDNHTAWFNVGTFKITQTGLLNGTAMCIQIAGIVMIFSFLVRTTAPTSLADGLETLFSPLKKLGVPVHDLVLMFTIALRFLPILSSEFHKIRKAQIARGFGFHEGTLSRRLRSLFPLLFPIFIQTMMRADELATAMIARCYTGEAGRTPLRIRNPRASWLDSFIVGIPVVLLVVYLIIYCKRELSL